MESGLFFQFDVGLVVGKFSPLHNGHLLVIETAKARCKRVVVLSYSNPILGTFDAEERRYWFDKLFAGDDQIVHFHADRAPTNDADERIHRLFCAQWYDRVAKQFGPPNAVFTSEQYGDGFAAFLEDYYNTPVVHVCVDPQRKRVPTSGTAMRATSVRSSERLTMLHHVVRSSMVPRIAFVGGESTGKTTLINAVTAALRERGVNVGVAEEFGRTYGTWTNNKYELDDMEVIAEEHVRRERAAQRRYDVVLCDTTPMVTEWYSDRWYGQTSSRLAHLSQRRYDYTFLCDSDIPFHNDGTRVSDDFRKEGTQRQERALRERNVEYTKLTGLSLQSRIDVVIFMLAYKGFVSM